MKINWSKSKRNEGVYVFATVYPEMKLKEISLKNIHPFFTESGLDRKHIVLEIKENMVKGNVIPPIVLKKSGRLSGYSIEDGNHRYWAAKSLMGSNGKILAWVLP